MPACTGEPAPGVVLPVVVHTLPECDVSSQVREHGNLALQAFGDFEPSNESAEVLPVRAEGTALRFPPGTRAIGASIDDLGSSFAGYGEMRDDQRFDVLLWPSQRECSVFRPDGPQGYPGKGGGQALGYARGQRLLLAAGGNDALVTDAIRGALSFDVATGAVTSFDTSQDQELREARAFATVTELGDKLLIAGGEHPEFGVPEDEREPRDTAELFDPKAGSFVGELIPLSASRTRHAAVSLPSGDTLLVGGRTLGVDTLAPVRLVEVISAQTLRNRTFGTLAERVEPRALLLDDGRVFVGGGVNLEGRVVETSCEWLSPDFREVTAEACIPPRFERAFVALPGASVLAVGGCQDRDGEAVCPPEGPPEDDYDAWWIARDGSTKKVTLPANIVAARPILLPGSDGSPWLVAALESDPDAPRLFRFNPWAQPPSFSLADVDPSVRLPRPDFPQPVSIDPDAFVWLDDDGTHGELFGLRLGTRNRYTQDLALVLLSDPEDPSRPLHLVPDRPLPDPREYLDKYDGRLWLSPEGGITVAVADTDYGDVRIAVQLAEPDERQGFSESLPPVLLLGGTPFGEGACAWPVAGSKRGGDFDVPTLVRRGTSIELRFRDETTRCPVAEGRLPLGLRAAGGLSVIEQLEIRRGAP